MPCSAPRFSKSEKPSNQAFRALEHESFHAFQGMVAANRLTGAEEALSHLGKSYSWDDPSFKVWSEMVTGIVNSFCRGEPMDRVVNAQMIIDADVTEHPGGKTFIVISRPVLQRMIDGTTSGLAIKPLGAVVASFYSMENRTRSVRPALRFTIDPRSAP